MHALTVQTKFTFGDRGRFDSRIQGCSGVGKVFAITVDWMRRVDYIIEIDQGSHSDLQPGILDDEMVLLGDSS